MSERGSFQGEDRDGGRLRDGKSNHALDSQPSLLIGHIFCLVFASSVRMEGLEEEWETHQKHVGS